MKNLYFFVFIVAFPFILAAQNIHGLWSGTLLNDSTHRTQNFELGLSEYRGKITGYTYTTFINNDTFYYSIKRVRAERKDGKLVIQDEEMVGNNFPERSAKHVKQTTTFPLINDSTIDISNGRWTTNQTKIYYSIGGSTAVREQQDEKKSDLLAHLDEANIKTDIVARNPNKKDEVAKKVVVGKPAALPKENTNTEAEPNPDAVVKRSAIADNHNQGNSNKIKSVSNNSISQTKPIVKNDAVVVVVDTKDESVAKNSNPQPVLQNKPAPKKDSVVQVVQKEQTVTKSPEKQIVNAVSIAAPVSQKKESIEANKQLPSIVADRKNESMQDIYFKNDSLVLSLYDNGIVDGDTVSVYLNGETIISKQMLKTVATKKTIYISSQMDSVQLVLFAENLGTIPPNTGLLTVRDGDEVYQVRFSADLQKNASITFRRKK
jgi:hypothetical protein